MPYATVGELPPMVRGALDEQGQKCWMAAFNKNLENGDERFAWKKAWHFVAKKEDSRFISGILSRGVVDDQREKISQKAVSTEFNDLIWNYGATINDTHTNRPVGVWFDGELEVGPDGIEQVRAYGMAYKGKPYYDEVWGNIQGQKIKALSIGIMKIDNQYQCDDQKCWRQVDKLQVFEGSVVGKGSCPGTKIDQVNFSAKGEAMPEETKGTETAPPGANEMSNKDTLGLGDAGVEALQKILSGVAEVNKRVAELDTKLSSHILEEKQEKMTENPEGAPPQDGKPPVSGEKPGEAPKDEKKDDAKEKMSDKGAAITPPMAPSSPASETDILPVQDPPPVDPEVQRKAADLAAVQKEKELREMAEKEGATTPRPESAAQDQGTKRVDSLNALLNDPAKLRSMSAMDIERFVDKYAKGEI